MSGVVNPSTGIETATIDSLEAQAIRLNRDIALAVSRRENAASRETDLVRKVGHAKGRLEIKDDVVATLERLQEAIYEKTVGSYAKLLTSLVHEVIDPQTDIIIDLGIERGSPALSIWSCISGAPEFRSSIYENSGAMTNVVCAGLRIITTAKSGGRRFLMLDEPDCWLPPARVPYFYNVLKELCEELDFQILVVSHHSPDLFGDTRIIPLIQGQPDLDESNDAEEEVNGSGKQRRGRRKKEDKAPKKAYTGETGSIRGGTSWEHIPADRPGIRTINIKNFATLKDVTLDLDPYLTVIAGDSNVGKSRVTRALRAAFYGSIKDVDDSDIRYGQNSLSVDITFEHNHMLSFSREKKRNPVNLWELKNAEGQNLYYEGSICHEGGTKSGAPSWVAPMLGIVRNGDLDLQISHQKSPVFLLDQTPSRQATVLSIGQEVEWLSSMQSIYKKKLADFNQTVKKGEVEIAEIREYLNKTADIENILVDADKMTGDIKNMRQISTDIKSLFELMRKIQNNNNEIQKYENETFLLSEIEGLSEPEIENFYLISEMANQILNTSNNIKIAEKTKSVLEFLPEVPQIDFDQRIVSDAENIRNNLNEIEILRRSADLLKDIPEEPPTIEDFSDISNKGHDIRVLEGRISKGRTIIGILSELPEEPDISSAMKISEDIASQKDKLMNTYGQISSANKQAEQINREYDQAEAERARLIEEAGGECPVCMSPLIDEAHKKNHERNGMKAETVPMKSEPVTSANTSTNNLKPQINLPRRTGFGVSRNTVETAIRKTAIRRDIEDNLDDGMQP